MPKIINITVDEIIPDMLSVLKGAGIPDSAAPSEKIVRLAEKAVSIFENLVRPSGIIKEIAKSEFDTIYYGEGNNEVETPLNVIYKSSTDLALFAVTIGNSICGKITELFDKNDFAIGSMLDSAASEGVELAAQVVETHYCKYLKAANRLNSSSDVMRFSPGYCGWDITAQRKLFDFLSPENIGIELNESYLMNPLKSISGVIVAGLKENLIFDDNYLFCKTCKTHSCRVRMNKFENNI